MRWGAIMKDETLLGPWVRRFLLEHLVAERNLARNTQVSYRDILALLLPFASKHGGQAIDRMTVEDLTPSLVRTFLDHLERDRNAVAPPATKGSQPSDHWRGSSACAHRRT
jgi:site-specific recombinase XerD